MVRRSVKRYTKKKRNYSWKSKKKYSRKKKRSGALRVGVRNEMTNSFNFLPNNTVMKMTYYQDVIYNTTGVNQSDHLYRTNSIFDPDATLFAGTQPLFHDQAQTFFERYVVLGAKVTSTFRWAINNTVNHPVLCYSVLDNDVTMATTTSVGKREAYPKCIKTLRSDPSSVVTLSSYFSAKKFFSSKDPTDDHQICAEFGANPVRQGYCHVGIQSIQNLDSPNILVSTKIVYIVKLIDPKEPTTS